MSSGVADQPLGDEETKSGAINRARNAYQAYLQKYSTAPAFAIGMEGGVALIRDDTGPKSEECIQKVCFLNNSCFIRCDCVGLLEAS